MCLLQFLPSHIDHILFLKTFTVTVNLTNFSLTTLSQDVLDFGVLESSNIPASSKTRTQTPEF